MGWKSFFKSPPFQVSSLLHVDPAQGQFLANPPSACRSTCKTYPCKPCLSPENMRNRRDIPLLLKKAPLNHLLRSLSLSCLLIYMSVAIIPIMWEPWRRSKNGPCTLRTKLFLRTPSPTTTTAAPPLLQGLRAENPKPLDLNAQRSPALQNLLPSSKSLFNSG